jgi:site-specific DNA recombinase
MTSRNGLDLVIYGRVSVDRSKTGKAKSVDDQIAWLCEWAAREGHRVVEVRRDDGISASRFARSADRPGWQQVMADIADGRANGVAVWEASRASRDRRVWVALLAALEDAGGVFCEGGKVHDPSDPDDAFTLDLQAALSGRESAMTRKRVLRAVHSRAMEGRPHGQPVYGTRIEYDPETGKPLRRVLDVEASAIVREIARRLLAGGKGNSSTALARDLNERGIPSPKGGRWSAANLCRMITQPSLAGLRTYRGEVLEGVDTTSPAVLDVETHRRLVALISDPARRTTRDGSHRRSLLVGTAVCGVCDGPVRTVTKPLSGGRRSVAYVCRKFCTSREMGAVDDLVGAVMVGLLSRPGIAAALRAEDPAASTAADERARLLAKLEEARRLVAEDRLSLTSLADLEARLAPRIAELERAARPRHVPDAVLDATGPDAAERWEALDSSARRAIVSTLAHVRILPAGRRDRTIGFDPATVEITPRIKGA